MAIRFPDPPPGVPESAAGGRAAGGPGAQVPAQPVFTVGLDELIEAGGEAAAEQTAGAPATWRYSRFSAGGVPEVLEVPAHAAGGAVAAGDDRFSPSIREALAVADQDPRVEAHDYEARLYRVPALSLLALWLHAPDAPDLFVPVGPPAPGLEHNRLYEDSEFMSVVRDAAERMRGLYGDAEDPDALGS